MEQKSVYICGPLTELPEEDQGRVKALYSALADVIEGLTGLRAFVPHEHYDPIKHAHYIPPEIDAAERAQVCTRTSLLLVVVVGPSWGGGIEVEMANKAGVPAVILCIRERLEARKVSRLLRGNPAVTQIIPCSSEEDMISELRFELPHLRYVYSAV